MRRGSDLLSLLYRRGARFWIEAGQLRYEAPKRAISPQELSELRTCKSEIMELLRQIDFSMEPPLTPREPGCQVPLTPAQLLHWQWAQKQGTDRERFFKIAVRAVGALDVWALQRSIEAVVKRHESLRTRFVKVKEVPRPYIDVFTEFPIKVCNLEANGVPDAEMELQRRAELFAHEKVDVSVGPLFAAKLFRLSDSEHVLIVAVDHLVSDAVSLEILDREVWGTYLQGVKGLPISLPDIPVQLADYAVWEQQAYALWKSRNEAYWIERFRDAPPTKIPHDPGLLESENPEGQGEVRHFSFCKALSIRLHALARREQVLTAFVVLSIYVAVMSRWCKQRDLTLLFVSNGRHRPELRNVIGCLADCLYLRISIDEGATFSDLLKRISFEYYSADDHRSFNRSLTLVPEGITDLWFNWLPFSWIPWLSNREWAVTDTLTLRPYHLRNESAAPFVPYFFEAADGIGGMIFYRPDLFLQVTIERFIQELRFFAQEVAADPFKRLCSISTVAVNAQERLLPM